MQVWVAFAFSSRQRIGVRALTCRAQHFIHGMKLFFVCFRALRSSFSAQMKPRSSIEQALEKWLAEGRRQIGELVICGGAESGFEILHYADASAAHRDLQLFNTPQAAREIARFDVAGNFRPLKSAPNLRRGWLLKLRGGDDATRELREALDFFYPAMLGTLLAHQRDALEITPLRETLRRQSGMYAVTKRISNERANELIGSFCTSRGGCLKTILWQIESGVSVTTLSREKFDPSVNQASTGEQAIPLLCAEACNLLVAEIRRALKAPRNDE